MNKWSYMQKCLYSKQPRSKSKIVTIQAAGKKLQEISWNQQENQRRLFCRRVFLQEITGGCRKTRQVFGNHFLRSLAALWMFCFRCSFSCCKTFPGKNDFILLRTDMIGAVKLWKLLSRKHRKQWQTKWKLSNAIQTCGPAIGWNVFPWTSKRVTVTTIELHHVMRFLLGQFQSDAPCDGQLPSYSKLQLGWKDGYNCITV